MLPSPPAPYFASPPMGRARSTSPFLDARADAMTVTLGSLTCKSLPRQDNMVCLLTEPRQPSTLSVSQSLSHPLPFPTGRRQHRRPCPGNFACPRPPVPGALSHLWRFLDVSDGTRRAQIFASYVFALRMPHTLSSSPLRTRFL